MVNTISKQETFNQAYTHLMKQGRKSENDTLCLYRYKLITGEVLKCGAGIFITDEQYTPKMESTIVDDPGLVRDTIINNGHDIDLVTEIQAIHDNIAVANWEKHLINLATRHNLTVPV